MHDFLLVSLGGIASCLFLGVPLYRARDRAEYWRLELVKLAAQYDELARENVRLEAKVKVLEGAVEHWETQWGAMEGERDMADSQREFLCREVLRLKTAAKKKPKQAKAKVRK